MTARTPVYIDSGKLHVFEDGDTLPPWLSPSSMAWENLTGVPAGLTELAALTGPGYAKLDSAGAWSVQAAIPQADVSGLATTLAGLQPVSARLTAIAGLTDSAGWLRDDGAGNWAITTPTASQVGAESALGSPSTSGYLLSSNSAGVRSWVAPYSLPVATASVLGGVKVGAGLSISSGALSVSYGTAAGTACAGNDSRLSDSRTPTAHALDGALHTISGKTAGQALLATSATAFGFVTVSGDATLSGAGALALATLLTAGSAGSAASVPTLTWDAKGRLTSVGSATISIPHTQISDWGTYINQPLLTTSSPTFASATIANGVYRTYANDATVAAIYGYAVTPSGTNYALAWNQNGNGAYLNGTISSNLFVNNLAVLSATATGIIAYQPIAGNLTGTASNANQLGGRNYYNYVWGNGTNYGITTVQLSAFSGGAVQNGNVNQLLTSTFADGYFTDVTQVPQTGWWTFVHIKHSDPVGDGATSTWGTDWAAAMTPGSNGQSEQYCVRSNTNSSYGAWRTLVHSGNYPEYNNFSSGLTTTTLTASTSIEATSNATLSSTSGYPATLAPIVIRSANTTGVFPGIGFDYRGTRGIALYYGGDSYASLYTNDGTTNRQIAYTSSTVSNANSLGGIAASRYAVLTDNNYFGGTQNFGGINASGPVSALSLSAAIAIISGGTLSVTGATTLSGVLNANAGISLPTISLSANATFDANWHNGRIINLGTNYVFNLSGMSANNWCIVVGSGYVSCGSGVSYYLRGVLVTGSQRIFGSAIAWYSGSAWFVG